MEKNSHIVQLREREREITFFPRGAVAAPQQPVLLEVEQEEPLADKIWRLARPGLLRAAFIFSVVWGGMLAVKIGNFLINTGGLK